MFDNSHSACPGRLHLSFDLGGKSIAYAYIRKNACKTFKRALGFDGPTPINRIKDRFSYDPSRRYDATIFVYRDPVSRLMSLYQNKIVDGVANEDLVRAYRSAMREEPSTFERFVDFAGLSRDPHTWTQHSHLLPIHYTHAIPLQELHATMISIVGEEAAAPFATRANPSDHSRVTVTEAALAKIARHYADDFDLIRRIEAS